jgi:TatA/E family protein of Tat protein translocase
MDGLFANPLHWVVLLVIVLIIFGPGKLPGVGSALGKSLREFKRATTEGEPSPTAGSQQPVYSATGAASAATSAAHKCAMCSHDNTADARFCASCGTPLPEPALETTATAAPPVSQSTACTDCGTENPPTSRFCAHCGRMLEASMQRV